MKPKLLSLLMLIAISANAQSQITEYYGQISASPLNVGVNYRTYVGVTSATPLDQSTAGENVTWTYNDLIFGGSSEYFIAAPTAQEIANYPNTNKVATNVVTVNGVPNESKLFFSEVGTSVSFTGAATNGLLLNYDTNNAKVGDFPMNYGYSNTDTTAGNYDYNDGEYSGTFTGTITTNVDAYGVLNLNSQNAPTSEVVTRMKTVQTISLNYGFFSNIGTVVQTTYHYFRNYDATPNDLFPAFTVSTSTISVPLLSIDQTVTIMEYAFDPALWISQFSANNITLAQNPVNDLLSIHISNNAEIQTLRIVDVNGRVVLHKNLPDNTIDVSSLTKGLYFAEIKTDSGTEVKKFIKN